MVYLFISLWGTYIASLCKYWYLICWLVLLWTTSASCLLLPCNHVAFAVNPSTSSSWMAPRSNQSWLRVRYNTLMVTLCGCAVECGQVIVSYGCSFLSGFLVCCGVDSSYLHVDAQAAYKWDMLVWMRSSENLIFVESLSYYLSCHGETCPSPAYDVVLRQNILIWTDATFFWWNLPLSKV